MAKRHSQVHEDVVIFDPTITPEQLQHYSQLDDELRVPNFIVYVLEKP